MDGAVSRAESERSSIEKLPLREESAFERLPDEIIEHILQLTSPNGFASLIVLNSKWRMVSQQAHLYALHLSRCPSYSAAHRTTPIPDDEDSLPKLRRLFAREIKCNLFEAYLRPQETIINLVSTSISSSSAPGGEAFHFSLSPRGHYVLAYSSSRIHVIDVTGPDITVKRELKIVRRPVSTTITDDGALLAVLSTDLQVNLYDLTGEHPKRTRAVELDYSPRTIALSPMGSVLAAAYDSGVEVSSLDPDFARIERRAVKCYAAESLSFSKNGTQLLGTTTQSQNPSTVVLTAPYYDPSNLPEENVSTLWTTSILFPNGSRDCSHATLLPSPTADEASWTFTYDRVFETFRAVRIDDLRNGTTYFTGPTSDSLSKLVPSTLPTASETGDLVSAGFQGSIWLYGVPEDLEALPNNSSSTDSNVGSEPGTPSPLPRRRNSAPSLRSVDRQNSVRTPQWKLLCDRARNTFVEGRKISSLERVNAMTWVNDNYTSFHKERLVAVAPGVTSQPIQMEDDGMNPVDGGRISILDFDYSLSNGGKSVITIEVGAEEPDVLEEEHRDIDAEVALVRRRTVAQKRGTQNSVARSATAAAAAAARATARPPVPPVPNLRALGDPFTPPSPRRSSITSNDNSETVSIDEGEALDAPYSHTSPRSAPTLRRAATAAAVNRRLHPRAVAGEHIEFRRADGREEHPHESDADNWVPPPPPYTKDAVPPLPEHIQRSILAEAAAAAMQRTNAQRPPNLEFLDLDARPLQRSRTTASVSSNGSRREHGPFTPARSDSTARPIGSLSLSQGQRPVTSYTSQASPEFDDLYDVSPPGSPGPMARMAPPTPPTPLMRPSPQQPSPPSPPTRAPPAPPTPPTPLTPQALSVDEAAEPNISPVSASTAPSIPNEGPASKTRLTPPALNITEEGSDQESTPRPSEDHITRPVLRTSIQRRAVEPQPAGLSKRSVTAPVMTSPSSAKQDPVPIQYRTNTAPVSIQLASSSSTSSASPQMIMPRADQLARLNSRRGRPAGVTDPWRSSGLFNQPRAVSSADNFTWNHGQHAAAPPGAEYRRQGSSSMRPNTTYLPSSRHNIPSPAVPELKPLSISNSNVRQGLPESHLQPPMPHLETIHSVNSEPSPWVSKPMAVGVSRQPSRAERSAAKNIKDAKKRGWRGMKKDDSSKRKEKRFDVASSAGWSDVPSMPSDVRDWQDYKAKKAGKKCRVM
ncbi:hypothetical protein OIDMADRAFT_40243 [Oidiodendron maius Zn]|uniref:F-box domain-containing protein n=1 Tax=Oidiodendron maius (strain Zn) TaxID=913774 RepID=A0A0C3H7K9_OIDMZ|nr:hypothetical protein OIDMADRAFT_40243 [Oidiodendron maius Zn]